MRPMRLCLFALAATVAALCSPARVAAIPFICSELPPPTLATEYDQASLVLFGRFANATPGPLPDTGTTEFIIDIPFKKHPIIAGKERITIPRFLPDVGKKPYLIFCDISKGTVDAYRAVLAEPGSDLPRYFRGLLMVRQRPLAERLRYAFDFFGNPDREVAEDARRQFVEVRYKGYRAVAKTLPRAKLAAWLRDEKTPPRARGLYALLLSECGTAKDADLLRELLTQKSADGAEALLAAVVLLQRNEGWTYVRELLADGNQDFPQRYQALRALRFFWEERPDVIPRADRLAALLPMLAQPDMSDFAIEELRKRGCLGMTDRILPLFDIAKFKTKATRNAILRYALYSPSPRAAAFVREQRRLDPLWVKDVEELLALEGAAP